MDAISSMRLKSVLVKYDKYRTLSTNPETRMSHEK